MGHLGGACGSLLIIVVDNTIVNVTLPSLVRQLGASVSQLQWVVDAYTVIFARLLLLAGTLGDRWRRRRARKDALDALAEQLDVSVSAMVTEALE